VSQPVVGIPANNLQHRSRIVKFSEISDVFFVNKLTPEMAIRALANRWLAVLLKERFNNLFERPRLCVVNVTPFPSDKSPCLGTWNFKNMSKGPPLEV
jgi:hypothetical protein